MSLGGNFSAQSDNLSKEQLYTTKGFVYSANAALPINEKFNVTAGYNGYLQRQYDGVAVVNDTTRINRRMNSFTLTPNFNTSKLPKQQKEYQNCGFCSPHQQFIFALSRKPSLSVG